jgi:tRNA 2-thiouridine synthesizing protein A
VSEIAVKETLDVRGLACPMPVVKTRLAIDKLEVGDVLRVLATDRGSLTDIPAWAEATGNKVVSADDAGGEITFLVEKG